MGYPHRTDSPRQIGRGGLLRRRIKQLIRYHKFERLYKKYERWLVPGMLIMGVAADYITFRSIQINTTFILLAVYFALAGTCMTFSYAYDAGRVPHQNLTAVKYLHLATPLIIQFTFGALLSASLIFYWFSGALSVSWPLILIIAALMASNEVLRRYFLKPVIQISVYFFILFSLLSLILPFIFDSISFWLFIAADAISLAVSLFYILALTHFFSDLKGERLHLIGLTLIIAAAMNALYFSNIIPPIPLSVREAGVYHDVQRSGNAYILKTETQTWLEKIQPGQTIHIKAGERVYVFTSIFAPAKLQTKIYHRWQYYDEPSSQWVERGRYFFFITGGRDAGYRGFSTKANVPAGKWRVYTETERGQVLGRIKFIVEHVNEHPAFENLVR